MSAARGPRCLFRVAAGPRIGFGHVTRVRALARALGAQPLVSVRGGSAARRGAVAAGCVLLAGGPMCLDGLDLLVVDDPSVSHAQRWVRRARRAGIATVALHDGRQECASADLIVNMSAPTRRLSRSPTRLSGPAYYLLDTRSARPRRRATSGTRVLIALGGGSHVRRAAGVLVRAIAHRAPAAEIRVAAGLTSGPLPPIDCGRWVVSPRGLDRYMAAADVIVAAGGVTLHEACALGRSTVAMAVVPSQRPAIRALATAGAVLDAGGPTLTPETADRVGSAVATLLDDSARRRDLARRARRIVDGQGARRVATHIRALLGGGGTHA